MNECIRKTAISKARQSISGYKISAIGISKNGNIISKATNHPRFDRYGGGLHAEMKLLRKCGNRISTIILCRVNRNGGVLPIEPCPRCKKILDRKMIKVITVNV